MTNKTKNLENAIRSPGWVDFHDRSKSYIFSESHIQLWNISEGMLMMLLISASHFKQLLQSFPQKCKDLE